MNTIGIKKTRRKDIDLMMKSIAFEEREHFRAHLARQRMR